MALAAMAVYAGSVALIPIGLEWIVAGFAGETERFSPSPRDVALWGPIIIAALGAANAISQYIQTRLSASAALMALRDLQNDMFEKFLALDFAQQRHEPSGQVISRFTNDMTVLRETLARASKAVKSVLELGALIAMILWYDWVLALAFLSVYVVIGIPVGRIGSYLRKTSAAAQNQAGELTSLIGETVAGARMVKTFQIEPLERARAAQAFETRLSLFRKMANARALNEPIIFFAGSLAIGLVISIVAFRINAGALTLPEFTAFIGALLLMSQPARALGTLNAVLQEGLGAFERMTSLIDRTPTIITAGDALTLPAGASAIRFDNVCFSYTDQTKALDGVTLEIPSGKFIALVGPSGGGKSTLANLIPRLFDPTKGRVLINGHDIAKVTLRSLRENVTMVSQDATIFNMSALENIAFGKPGASRADIIRAAEQAGANDFISTMPNAYDTLLGEGGAILSGGQRQRIALARAFLKNAPILVLDEPTSALDAESELKIQEALDKLADGRTTIVIAHRLATVKSADMIAVMAEGKIIETGTHEALIELDGLYARHAAMQLLT